MQQFAVLDAAIPQQREAWLELWNAWPEREVFAHPDYVRLFAQEGQGVMCAVSESTLYPFLYRPLADWADISSAYGYSGPFSWGNGTDSGVFWAQFEEWAKSRSVVSEVIRFSLFEDSLLPYAGERQRIAGNIVRDLDVTETELLADFEHKVRKNIRRAAEQGVTIEVDIDGSRIDEFLAIYEATMQRRQAADSYFFPRSFFETIHRELPGQFVYFFAVRDGEVISTELVLASATRLYSYLGGTVESAFEYRPNDLLKVEIMRWGMRNGKKQFVLGGGYTPEDGIYRYKQSFAPNGRKEFYIGARIFDAAKYEELVAARRQKEPPPRPNFFPEYRA